MDFVRRISGVQDGREFSFGVNRNVYWEIRHVDLCSGGLQRPQIWKQNRTVRLAAGPAHRFPSLLLRQGALFFSGEGALRECGQKQGGQKGFHGKGDVEEERIPKRGAYVLNGRSLLTSFPDYTLKRAVSQLWLRAGGDLSGSASEGMTPAAVGSMRCAK